MYQRSIFNFKRTLPSNPVQGFKKFNQQENLYKFPATSHGNPHKVHAFKFKLNEKFKISFSLELSIQNK